MTHAALLNEPESAPWPRGVLASYENVTPPRSEDQRQTRSTDANRLSFSLQLVIGIVTVALTVYGAAWAANARNEAANAAMRTDIALIRQMQADQAKIEEYKTKLDEERSSTITRAITELKAKGEMLDLKFNNLRETVLTNQRR